jgi:3-isopropylmalate/(R)-2-methylmalate dehydratase small subunit
MTGVVWRFGDDVDTDVLAPGTYLRAPIAELASHCLEALEPRFAAEVRPGDVVVAGENFGAGSSREQAVLALRELRVGAVIARSFAGIFYRNALNLGLLALVCSDPSALEAGRQVEVDGQAAVVRVLDTGNSVACEPIPGHLLEMVADGGLVAHLERRFRAEGR